ncbi:OLC1v1001171C1 [Oldenlandia corymbosa var. corymbosa]|uniref:OLC1v1001171C1 n=1 Tax=Oldenlandia corymbosa var. corymbosa TaxID=529605 RepID=A0AAV1D5T6_OLDCO|nr:OLC1v1001171C1 [Oldenlandia corymbosa var. corymbosa]
MDSSASMPCLSRFSAREIGSSDDYVIPYGDWFRYVSCPHYLAEIVIYAGILVASGCSDITVWLLFIFVANLVFAAADTQQWYLRKFDNYPRERYAIIPCRKSSSYYVADVIHQFSGYIGVVFPNIEVSKKWKSCLTTEPSISKKS